jgi:hypothetical protein
MPRSEHLVGKNKVPGDLQAAWRASRSAGWAWVVNGRGHVEVRNAEGLKVTTFSTGVYGFEVGKVKKWLREAGCPGLGGDR